MRVCVCAYREVRSQTTEWVRDVRRGWYHSGAGGCSAGDCAAVVYGVAAYHDGDYGDEALGGRDYGVSGDDDAGYYDYGGGSECEKRESGSGGCWSWEDYGYSGE